LVLCGCPFLIPDLKTLAVDVNRRESDDTMRGFPAVMSESYEAQEISVDNTYPIIIYHKVTQKRYAEQRGGQFGDRNKGVQEQAFVKMVVYGKYSAIQMRQEQLEALITSNFPDEIQDSLTRPLKLNSLMAELQSSNLNSAAVWAEEYRNVPLALAPEDIYFSINYTLTSTWRKGCIKICDCE